MSRATRAHGDTSVIKLTFVVLVAAAAALLAPAARADIVYDYVSRPVSYTPPGQPVITYGDRIFARLVFNDGLITTGFTGTLDKSQFAAFLGTNTTFALQAAGDYPGEHPGDVTFPPGYTSREAFVTFTNGAITDWLFETDFYWLGNIIAIGASGQGELIRTFPRVVGWAQGSTNGPGTWTLQPSPVPLPAAAYLLAAGLAALGAGTRRRREPATDLRQARPA